MRVAHFVQRYPPALGGSEAYFARLSKTLVARGDRVTVFTSSALDLEAFWSRRGRCLPAGRTRVDGVEVERYAPWRWLGRRYILKALSLIPIRRWQCLTLPCNPISFRMWREAGNPAEPFDVVHATAFPYAWPIACAQRLARRLQVPFLLTPFLHLGDPADDKDRTRKSYTTPALLSLIQAADRVFVQTEWEGATLVRLGIPEEKIVLQGMGIHEPECTGGNRENTRQSWGVLEGDVVVGHLANNSEEKGSVDLLRAAERLWALGEKFHLVLAGPEMPNFLKFWQKYGPAARVRRLGQLSEEQKRDFFAGLDVFALPSRSDSFGIVLLEAWANGIPNIGYRAGGIAEVIQHERDGLLARCGDIEELAENLMRLIEDRELRERLGRAGQEKTRREFRWDQKLAVVLKIYDEMKRAKESTRLSSAR